MKTHIQTISLIIIALSLGYGSFAQIKRDFGRPTHDEVLAETKTILEVIDRGHTDIHGVTSYYIIAKGPTGLEQIPLTGSYTLLSGEYPYILKSTFKRSGNSSYQPLYVSDGRKK